MIILRSWVARYTAMRNTSTTGISHAATLSASFWTGAC